jgi:DNA invertase Pin-like site-specific DNA recombinase
MLKSTTEETEALILELHAQGKSIAQIATETGLNRSVVAQFLLVHCPETRTKKQRALIDRIKAVGVDPSLSLAANARRHNVHVLTIKAVFHDLGLTPTHKEKDERAKRILELRQAGVPYREIAKQVGLSHEQVRQIVYRISRSSARRTRTPIDSGCSFNH